jgi:hypothetical protein
MIVLLKKKLFIWHRPPKEEELGKVNKNNYIS